MGRTKKIRSVEERKKAHNYCKKYRQKNKEAYRKADIERKKLTRESLKYLEPKKYQLRLAKDRARSQRNRESKRNETIDLAVDATQASTTTTKSKEQEKNAFSTRQAYQRSIKKAEKHLPFSPRKRLEVVGELAQKFKLRIKLPGKRGRKNRTLTEDQENFLLDVFERSDMTYTTPGRKDNVYIGKIDGEKTFVQKRYLLWNLRDALNIINTGEKSYATEFGEALSFSCFYNFIKKHKQFVYQ